MIKLTDLTMKNFLSVGNATQAVKLDDHGLTLVLGSNTDSNGGITRNGAGKSTILQAISYALYGKPLTKIKIPNLVNNINAKAMLVTLEFQRDGKKFRIERGKKPDVMRLYVDDIEQKLDTSDDTMGENRHTQEEIDRQIGMSHTMFKHVVALNTFTDPFLKLNAGDQRAIIEELLGVTQISRRAEVLKKLIGKTRESIRDHEAKIKATTEANDRISIALRQAETRRASWDTSHARRMADLAEEMAEMETIDFEGALKALDDLEKFLDREKTHKADLDSALREIGILEREADAHDKEAARLTRLAGQGVDDQVRRLEGDQTRLRAMAERHQTRVAEFTKDIEKKKAELDASDSSDCVCCGQKLQGTAHLDQVKESLTKQIEELTQKRTDEQTEITGLLSDAAAIDETIEGVKLEAAAKSAKLLEQAKKETELATAFRDQIIEHANVADAARSAITHLGEKPSTPFRSRDEVYRIQSAREKIEREIAAGMAEKNPHESEIENLSKAIQEIDYEPVNEQTALMQHQDFLLKLLSNKDSFIRKKIVDQNLNYLNTRLNHYLDKMGLPHEVVFQSDLTVDITNLGRDFDFEQLSRGEMNRVIMATSWSFRDMWESMNVSCNLLWVDEMLDQGTDGQGVEAALGILKSMARDRGKNVFLISHRDELQARIDRTLLVRKENGFTTLEADGVIA